MVKMGYPPSPHTKEVFYPVEQGTEMYYLGAMPAARINATADIARIPFKVPWDFTSLIALEIIVVADADVSWSYNWGYRFCTVGQNIGAHASSGGPVAKNLSSMILTAIDYSGVVPAFEPGDTGGLSIEQAGATTTNIYVLGIRLRYA